MSTTGDGMEGPEWAITKIASAPRALGGIHGARSERGRCQEHDASMQHAACPSPSSCGIHKQEGLLHRCRAQRRGPGREHAIRLRGDYIPCRDSTELSCISRKKSDQSGTGTWAIPHNNYSTTYSFHVPSPQSLRDQAIPHDANSPDRRQQSFPPPPSSGPSLEAAESSTSGQPCCSSSSSSSSDAQA